MRLCSLTEDIISIDRYVPPSMDHRSHLMSGLLFENSLIATWEFPFTNVIRLGNRSLRYSSWDAVHAKVPKSKLINLASGLLNRKTPAEWPN